METGGKQLPLRFYFRPASPVNISQLSTSTLIAQEFLWHLYFPVKCMGREALCNFFQLHKKSVLPRTACIWSFRSFFFFFLHSLDLLSHFILKSGWSSLYFSLVVGMETGEEYILFCFIFRYKIRTFKSWPKWIVNFIVKQVPFLRCVLVQHLAQQDSGRRLQALH